MVLTSGVKLLGKAPIKISPLLASFLSCGNLCIGVHPKSLLHDCDFVNVFRM